MPRLATDTCPSPREGDGSPQKGNAVSLQRSEEGRARHEKTVRQRLRRAQRRVQKAERVSLKETGEAGLKERLASFHRARGEEAAPLTPSVEEIPHGEKIIPPKKTLQKGRPTYHRRQATPKKCAVNLEILAKRQAKAQLRAIKREINKVLKFAALRVKKYGYLFYYIVLDFLCTQLESWHNNLKEAS